MCTTNRVQSRHLTRHVDKNESKAPSDVVSLSILRPQERFQVKSPPSTYLAKIKSLYQDQGGVSRRVSVKRRPPLISDTTFNFLPAH